MFGLIDNWHDWWRLANALICLHTLYLLTRAFRCRVTYWEARKVDFWFALCVWTFTGLISSVEGVVNDSDLGVRVVLVSAGALTTHRAVFKKYAD